MKSNITENLETKELIERNLPDIDEALKNKIPLSQRPLEATIIFFKYFVVEIDGYDKDDCHNNPLFPAILIFINDWYECKYGNFHDSDDGNLVGIVFIYEHPYKVSFPYSISVEGTGDNTVGLKFPIELDETEKWSDYLKNKPNLKKMDASIKLAAKADTANIVSMTRNIFQNCIGVRIDDDTKAELVKSIPNHIHTATNLLNSNSGSNLNNAMWNFHIAIEKAFKALLFQKHGTYPRTHDLFRLLCQLGLEDQACIELLLKKLPRDSTVIKKRYEPSDFESAFGLNQIYLIYLDLLSQLTDLLIKKISMKGATVIIKKPKYAGARLAD